MAIFEVDIEKRLNSEFWSNRYIVQAASLFESTILAGNIVLAERIIHSQSVLFTRYRASSATEGDNEFIINFLNVTGQRDPGSSLLPLFNTLRYDFNVFGGRPSRKYYRGVLSEGDINGEAVVATFPAFVTAIETLFNDEAPSQIVDPQGSILGPAVQYPFVQMRQLRRSRRKRTNGGGIFQ